MDSNDQEGWTTVGQKKSKSADKNIKNNKVNIDELFNQNISSDATETITKYVLNYVQNTAQSDRLFLLGEISNFCLSHMNIILSESVDEVKSIKDNQKQVLYLNNYIEHAENTISNIHKNISQINNILDQVRILKKDAISNIKHFLASCGINEIKKSVSRMSVTSSPLSYRNVFGTCSSELVVERNTEKKTERKIGKKNQPVNTNITSINVPTVANMQGVIDYTICYVSKYETFGLKLEGTIFTAGPSDFVNLKTANGKTKHAKRCLNDQPCRYKNCKYYHDPCIVTNNYNTDRNFALSYIIQLLSSVKNDSDILENKALRQENYLRDLVQLGGSILIKASQIKKLYF